MDKSTPKTKASFERIQQLILSEFADTQNSKIEQKIARALNKFEVNFKSFNEKLDATNKKTQAQYTENDHAIKSLSQAFLSEMDDFKKSHSQQESQLQDDIKTLRQENKNLQEQLTKLQNNTVTQAQLENLFRHLAAKAKDIQ